MAGRWRGGSSSSGSSALGGESVLLSHSEDGNRLTMEGTLNSNYFKIQKRVHEQYYFA